MNKLRQALESFCCVLNTKLAIIYKEPNEFKKTSMLLNFYAIIDYDKFPKHDYLEIYFEENDNKFKVRSSIG
jgi:hypothetical protein